MGVTAVYLVWIPLHEPTLALVSRATQNVLAELWSPPLITSLEVSGSDVDIRGLLFHSGQWMGRWAAGNLPIFVIASLGLAVAVPARDAPARAALVAGTLLVCFVAMVAISTVEVLVVAASWAKGREGLLLLSESERRILDHAHGTIDLVQLLLPGTLALVAYATPWSEDGRTRRPSFSRWRLPVALVAGLCVLVVWSYRPVAPPGPERRLERFARTAELNPDSRRARLALVAGEAQVLMADGDPCAARARLDRGLAGRPRQGDDPAVQRLWRRAGRRCRRAAVEGPDRLRLPAGGG